MEEYGASLLKDPLNESKGRNRRNTPEKLYNCGGFALSTYDWLCPYAEKPEQDSWTERSRILYVEDRLGFEPLEDITDEVVDLDANYLLRTYPFLKQVNLSDCSKDDTVIAYRIFIDASDEYVEDTDFHFRVRHNGFWFEKMGTDDITICITDVENPWGDIEDEDIVYNSKVVYFKTTRGFV